MKKQQRLLLFMAVGIVVPLSSQAQAAVTSVPAFLTKPEGRVFQAHADEILPRVNYRHDELMLETHARYVCSPSKDEKLGQYLFQREIRKACYDYIWPDSVRLRSLAKMRVDTQYQDSIDMLLIPEYYNRISGDNISYALHAKRAVRMDSTQYDYLMGKALDMAHRLRRNPRLNVWNEEMEILTKTLTKEQLDRFFRDKNARSVTKEMQAGWKRLTDAGLAEQLDSVNDMARAYFYFHERQKIKDLYKYNGTAQRKHLAELNKSMPTMVRMLDGLDKKARLEENERNNKTVGKEFVW